MIKGSAPHNFFAFLICPLVWGLTLFSPLSCLALELSGSTTMEGHLFVDSPQFSGQRRQSCSWALNSELYHGFASGSSLTISPFVRVDSADQERSHADLREANYLHVGDRWELRLGMGKVFWGACEFVHLVDIINQTDLVEALDGEEKLGQPMVHLSLVRDWGVVDTFLLPYFRERTFAGVKGRLRTALVVDTDHPVYESGSEEWHQDVALRYSQSMGDVDFGLSFFQGTSREPFLIPGLDKDGNPVLLPSYEQVSQAALDLQGVFGSWLVKAEAFYRSGYGRSFAATTLGFEYTLVGIFDSGLDLGFLGEYVFDDRQQDRAGLFNNDIMAGMRLVLNDAASSDILFGVVQDLEQSSRFLTVEAARRLNDQFLLTLEAAFFMDGKTNAVDSFLADDDFIKIEFAYYF